MTGFLETFVRFVDEIGTGPAQGAADRARADAADKRPRDRAAAERRAADIERIWSVLGGEEQ